MICHCLGKFSTTINDAKFGMGKNLYIKKKEKNIYDFPVLKSDKFASRTVASQTVASRPFELRSLSNKTFWQKIYYF